MQAHSKKTATDTDVDMNAHIQNLKQKGTPNINNQALSKHTKIIAGHSDIRVTKK